MQISPHESTIASDKTGGIELFMMNKLAPKLKNWLFLVGLLLAAVILTGTMLRPQPANPQVAEATPTPTATKALSLHSFAGEQITPTPQPTMPGIAIPGWTSIKIKAGETIVNVPFYNPEQNKDWYYLTFQLTMADTEKVLFTTGLIPPGQYCNLVSLDFALEAGTYEGTLFVQPYTMDSLGTTNNMVMPLEIIVYE